MGFAYKMSVLGKVWVPVDTFSLCTLGSLDVVSG